jgi:hypothetical protein
VRPAIPLICEFITGHSTVGLPPITRHRNPKGHLSNTGLSKLFPLPRSTRSIGGLLASDGWSRDKVRP